MKKIVLLIVAIALLATIFIIPAYARGGHGFMRFNTTNSTQNTADTETLIAARKAYLNILVEKEVITQEQADEELAYCKEMLENRNTSSGYGGCGGSGMGGRGCGMRGNW